MKRLMLMILIIIAGLGIFFVTEPKTREIDIAIFLNGSPTHMYETSDMMMSFYNKEIDLIEQAYPDYTFKIEYYEDREIYSEVIAEKIIKNEAPDIYMILPKDINTYVSKGALKELDLQVLNESDMTFPPTLWDQVKVKEKTYGFPIAVSFDILAINNQLLEDLELALPTDQLYWTDMYKMLEHVASTDIDLYGLGGYGWEHAMYTNSIQMFNDENNPVGLLHPDFEDSLKHYKKIESFKDGDQGDLIDFLNGKLLGYVMSAEQYKWITQRVNLDLRCLPLPIEQEGDTYGKMDPIYLGVNKRSDNPKVAEKIALELGLRRYERWSAYPWYQSNKHIINNMIAENGFLQIDELMSVIDSGIYSGVHRNEDYDDFIENIYHRVERLKTP